MSRGMPKGFDEAQREYDNRQPDDDLPDDYDPETDYDCYDAEAADDDYDGYYDQPGDSDSSFFNRHWEDYI